MLSSLRGIRVAWFTLFPSFFECGCLPMSESLASGKPCLISNRTSMPTGGSRPARTFEPDNLHDACAGFRDVVVDSAWLVGGAGAAGFQVGALRQRPSTRYWSALVIRLQDYLTRKPRFNS
jgi:hypothetical protein